MARKKLSAEAAFGRENIEPAADVDVTVYFRSDGKLETIELVTDKDGSYSLRGLDMNQSYVIVFESEGSVLFKTASNPPHHWIKEGDIALRRNAPGLTVSRNVIESELPERSTPEPFPLRTFL